MNKTQSHALAETYLHLGGTRLVLIDDNKTFLRQWEEEPAAAQQFWSEHIACLDEEKRREIALLLPAVSDQDTVQIAHDPGQTH
jgi:hypothetical protein